MNHFNMKTYIKDKKDFLSKYDVFAEKVFYKEIENDKVEIKIAAPRFQKEVKENLEKVKD